MSPIVSPASRPERFPRLQLRLLPGHGEPRPDGPAAGNGGSAPRHSGLRASPGLRAVGSGHEGTGIVLLAGSDPCRRATLRTELGETLPSEMTFAEADAAFEVLEHAPTSRLVVLAGDLDDVCAQSLVKLLGQRHPQLPVISVEAPDPIRSGARAAAPA